MTFINFAGLPPYNPFAGKFLVTTLQAATIEFSPIVTPFNTIEFIPIQTLSANTIGADAGDFILDSKSTDTRCESLSHKTTPGAKRQFFPIVIFSLQCIATPFNLELLPINNSPTDK